MKKNILFCILSTMFVFGCSSSGENILKNSIPVYKPSVVAEQEVYDELIKAARNIDKAFLVYTSVNNAAKREALTYEKIRQANWEAEYTPVGMGRRITLSWDGVVEPLLRRIASEVDYEIKFLGTPPIDPLIVSLVANETTIIDTLRDLSAKTDGIIDIQIHDKRKKIIEVIYVDRFK